MAGREITMGAIARLLGKLIRGLAKGRPKKAPKPPEQFPKQAPSATIKCPPVCQPATKEEILKGAKHLKTSSSRQFSKTGGIGQANKDFDALTRGGKITDRGNGLRTAEVSNGSKVIVRPSSSGGQPTLEIQPPAGKTIKIRYE